MTIEMARTLVAKPELNRNMELKLPRRRKTECAGHGFGSSGHHIVASMPDEPSR
jgi:hypothetical protein